MTKYCFCNILVKLTDKLVKLTDKLAKMTDKLAEHCLPQEFKPINNGWGWSGRTGKRKTMKKMICLYCNKKFYSNGFPTHKRNCKMKPPFSTAITTSLKGLN